MKLKHACEALTLDFYGPWTNAHMAEALCGEELEWKVDEAVGELKIVGFRHYKCKNGLTLKDWERPVYLKKRCATCDALVTLLALEKGEVDYSIPHWTEL